VIVIDVAAENRIAENDGHGLLPDAEEGLCPEAGDLAADGGFTTGPSKGKEMGTSQ
jgi:hypothetical protein